MKKPLLGELIERRDSYIGLLMKYPNSLWFPREIQELNEEIWHRKSEARNV